MQQTEVATLTIHPTVCWYVRKFVVNELFSARTFKPVDEGQKYLYAYELPDSLRDVVNKLYDIGGVIGVSIENFHVQVRIGGLRPIKWKDIEPQVIEVIQNYLGWLRCDVVHATGCVE